MKILLEKNLTAVFGGYLLCVGYSPGIMYDTIRTQRGNMFKQHPDAMLKQCSVIVCPKGYKEYTIVSEKINNLREDALWRMCDNKVR